MKVDNKILLISVIVFLLAGLLLMVNFDIFVSSSHDRFGHIGIVKFADSNVKVKVRKGVSWTGLETSDEVFNESLVFTEEGSTAEYELMDGTKVTQAPMTLLKFRFAKGKFRFGKGGGRSALSLNINLLQGSIDLETPVKHKVKSLDTKDATIHLKPQKTTLKVEQGEESIRLKVGEGGVELMKGNEALDVGEGEEIEMEKASPRKGEKRVAQKSEKPYKFPKGRGGGSGSTEFEGSNFKKFVRKLGRIFIITD